MNNLNSRCTSALIPHAQKTGKGFTLVEILIGITLGLFLTAGMFQLFIANKQTYKVQNDALRALDEVGFALGEVSSNARMAGFTGCPVSVIPTNVLKKDGTTGDWLWWYNLGDKNNSPAVVNGVRGYGSNSPTFSEIASGKGIPETGEGAAVPRTDAVVFLGGGGGVYGVTANDTIANPKTLTLTTLDKSDGSQLEAGNIVIMCNGINAELFQVTSVVPSTRKIGYAADTMTPCNDSTKLIEITNNFVEPEAGVTRTTLTDFTPVAFYLGINASYSGTNASYSESSALDGHYSLYQSRLTLKYEETDPPTDSPTPPVVTGSHMVSEELVRGVVSMGISYGVDTVTTDDTTEKDPTPRYIANEYRSADAVTDWQRVTTVRITLSLTNSSQPVTTTINIRNRSL